MTSFFVYQDGGIPSGCSLESVAVGASISPTEGSYATEILARYNMKEKCSANFTEKPRCQWLPGENCRDEVLVTARDNDNPGAPLTILSGHLNMEQFRENGPVGNVDFLGGFYIEQRNHAWEICYREGRPLGFSRYTICVSYNLYQRAAVQLRYGKPFCKDYEPQAPYFNEDFYIRANPDVAAAVQAHIFPSRFLHYTKYGRFENRQPSLRFDARLAHPIHPEADAVIASGKWRVVVDYVGSRLSLYDAKWHYSYFLTTGAGGQFVSEEQTVNAYAFTGHNAQSLVFDVSYYKRVYPELNQIFHGDNKRLAEHFAKHGVYEKRKSSPWYLEEYYLENNPDVAAAVRNGAFASGAQHFIRYGFAECRKRSPLYDTRRCLSNRGELNLYPNGRRPSLDGSDALYRFIENYRNPRFQFPVDNYYRQETKIPSNEFDEDRYLLRNPDVQRAVDNGSFVNGFEHYAIYGYFEGRSLN